MRFLLFSAHIQIILVDECCRYPQDSSYVLDCIKDLDCMIQNLSIGISQ